MTGEEFQKRTLLSTKQRRVCSYLPLNLKMNYKPGLTALTYQ